MYPLSVNFMKNKEIESLPNQYPDGPDLFGTPALNDFQAFETRRSVELGLEFTSVAGMVEQHGNFLTI